jgi:UDP-N-acetylglucosamine diphosphorylase/glucosamine-1-phosphate N-acetyltransferase
MTRTVVIFEDSGWRGLHPITLSRPAFECRVGVTTLGRRLAAQLARREMKRVITLCRPLLRPLLERDLPGHPVNHDPEGETIFLNGRLLMLGDAVDDLLGLLEKAVAVQHHGEFAAALVSGDRAAPFARDLAEALERGEPAPFPGDHAVTAPPERAVLVRHPWELIARNRAVLEDDFHEFDHPQLHQGPELAPGAQVLHRDRLCCREEVTVEAGAILDAGPGPIFLGEGVRVLHNAVIVGPVAVGPRSVIKIGARIEGGTSIGPVCKVGGEVEASILQGYANKQHDGYLGHSYLGAWTNLGAGTQTSDLKNNYSTVRVWSPGGEIDTGERFAGAYVGDHSKTAIGTLLNTGTVIGFSCNLFGAGFPPKHVPSFSWEGKEGLAPYDLDKAMATARAVMERRGVIMEPADQVLFRAVHGGGT